MNEKYIEKIELLELQLEKIIDWILNMQPLINMDFKTPLANGLGYEYDYRTNRFYRT